MSNYHIDRFRVIYVRNRKTQWFDADAFYYQLHSDGDLTIHAQDGKVVAGFARYEWSAVIPDLTKVEH